MANLREIKGRIDSVTSTMQVTRTMEMISTAKIRRALDRAQEAAKMLRQVQDSELVEDDFAQESETDYTAQLVAIYGKPYEDDIGPTGTYPQGYDGPDLYHYNYIDVSQYGIEEPKSLPVASYKLVMNTKEGRGVYSFCMCPGGYVISSSSGISIILEIDSAKTPGQIKKDAETLGIPAVCVGRRIILYYIEVKRISD